MGYDDLDFAFTTAGNYSNSSDAGLWVIISLVIAVIGGICLYFTVFSNSNKKSYTGFMAKLYNFVRFDKMMIIPFLKITYIISAIFITLASFSLISESFISFIVTLVFGNLITRVMYELLLVILRIYENTNEINKKIK